jgi:hypothetical protein
MLQQLATQLGHLPINIIFLSDGRIAFQRITNFAPIIDNGEVEIILTNENIVVNGVEICYNAIIEYKSMPDVIKWLQNQKLIYPL